MPTFTRKKKPLTTTTRKKRTFKRRRTRVVVKKAGIPKEKTKKEYEKEREIDDVTKKSTITEMKPVDDGIDSTTVEKEEIARLIEISAEKLRDIELDKSDDKTMMELEPDVFDGISSDEERMHLIEESLKAEQRRSARMKHEMELAKAEFEQEKQKLEKNISSLRKEMRGKSPIEDSNFFSLSNDLKVAVDVLEQMVDKTTANDIDNKMDLKTSGSQGETNVETVKPKKIDESPPLRTVVKPKTEETKTKTADDNKKESKDDKKTEKKAKKGKKMMITGGAVIAVVMLISGLLSVTLFSQPDVDEELVAEYMNRADEGDVAGATSDTGLNGEEPTVETQFPTISDEALTKKVPFEETEWSEFHDPLFGVRMDYPSNAVKVMKTDSSATFSRKEGYIFRIQMVETGLDLENYWNQVKATSYEYDVEEVEYQGYEAYYLVIKETIGYPGNKYLVKVGEKIFDIWYATPSDKFSQDDIRRAEQMLRTVNFTRKSEE